MLGLHWKFITRLVCRQRVSRSRGLTGIEVNMFPYAVLRVRLTPNDRMMWTKLGILARVKTGSPPVFVDPEAELKVRALDLGIVYV